MAKLLSPRQAGELMNLPHREIIRRIRKGDIQATKIGGNGWNWILKEEWVQDAMKSDWYPKSQKTAKAVNL
jgi:hypothetical protein